MAKSGTGRLSLEATRWQAGDAGDRSSWTARLGLRPVVDFAIIVTQLPRGFVCMSPDYNDYVLTSAYHAGWLTVEQYHEVAAALGASPDLPAIDFLETQGLITAEQGVELDQLVQAALASPPDPAESEAADFPNRGAATTVDAATAVDLPPIPSAAQGLVASANGLTFNPADLPNGMRIEELLTAGRDAGASDIHLGVGSPPLMRKNGTLQPLFGSARIMNSTHIEALLRSFLTPMQYETLGKRKALDFSYDVPGSSRFRASVVQQRKGHELVFRIVTTTIRTMDELGLPPTLKTLTQYHNGLVLITGSVGSGKSTTMASMVQEVNTHRRDHIITLEDPVEYVFQPDQCQITQREIHAHTESFSTALRASLREDPDVIMVGEMRDLETISLAITASETGHLVLGTLHTSNASRTLDRVLDAFPVEQQGQIRTMVSESLRGIVSQQLVPRADGQGRVLALEILVNTPAVANIIREAKTFMLPGVIQTGKKLGMRLMDDSLMQLLQEGVISPQDAHLRAEQKKLFEPYLASR